MDPEVHPEYADAYVAALPLADCAPVRGDRKQRLGKGKQAKTFRSAFVRATADGHEEVRAQTKIDTPSTHVFARPARGARTLHALAPGFRG